MLKTCGIDDNIRQSDYNTSSAGEDSCDTVIYCGSGGRLSDQNLTDNERPPSPNTFKAMKMKLSSGSSSDDDVFSKIHLEKQLSKLDQVKAALSACDESPEDLSPNFDSDDNILDSTANYSSNENLLDEDVQLDRGNSVPAEEIVAEDGGADVENDNVNAAYKDKSVNVVAPLIIQELSSEPKVKHIPDELSQLVKATDSYEQPDESLAPENVVSAVNQLTKAVHEQESPLIPYPSEESLVAESIRAPSEKELRKKEKRIAKLLKGNIDMDDDSSTNNSGSLKSKESKSSKGSGKLHKPTCSHYNTARKATDGYVSAPEAVVYCKKSNIPVQVVKGVVRQKSADSADESECRPRYDTSLSDSRPRLDTQDARDILKSFVAEKLGVQSEDLVCDRSNTPTSPQQTNGPITVDVSNQMATPPHRADIITSTQQSILEESHELHSDANEAQLENTSEAPKIQNLEHIITVTSVPNFAVSHKPDFTTLPTTPTLNTARKGSMTSEAPCEPSPNLNRTRYYSQDTISVVSMSDTEAYDSDNCWAASPGPSRRHRLGPTRLKYRWSTVYEEDEKDCKKDKVDKKSSKKSRGDKKDRSLERKDKKQSSIVKYDVSPRAKRVTSIKTASYPAKPPASPTRDKKSKDNRMSNCSDASSGIGSAHSSQTPSVNSGDEHSESTHLERTPYERTPSTPITPKSRRWIFG